MRRIILFVLVLCLTVTPCHALTFFQADYDADTYTTETELEDLKNKQEMNNDANAE